MSDTNAPNSLQQMVAEMAMALGQAMQTECAAWRPMRPYFWRAQAEILKGLLTVVESRIEDNGAEASPRRPASVFRLINRQGVISEGEVCGRTRT